MKMLRRVRSHVVLFRLGTTRFAFWLRLTALLWLSCPYALALNPTLDVSQYAHTAWRIREGFMKGHINSIAQTPDGFLWFGTEFGLLRFDGVQPTPWQPPQGNALPDNRIRYLLAARDGALWIGTFRGLASWSHGKLVTYPQFEGWGVNGITQDRQGTIWVTAASVPGGTQLCAIRSAGTECYGRDGSLGTGVGAISEDGNGNLWLVTTKGLWRWKPGPPQLFSLSGAPRGGLHVLSGLSTGEILVLTTKGIDQTVEGQVKEYWVAPASSQWRANSVLSDRDGAVWIGSMDRGLIHLHNGRIDQFGLSDGLSGDDYVTLFEDREANVWVATTEGLDRFRALPTTTYSTRQGVVGGGLSVLADRDGSVWFSTAAGLYRWQEDHVATYRPPHEALYRGPQLSIASDLVREVTVSGLPELAGGSLFQDRAGRVWLATRSGLGYLEQNRFVSIVGVPGGVIDSIAEDRDGNLWIAHREAGLLEVSSDRVVQEIPWAKISPNGLATRLAADPVHGGLWLGFFSGGVIHLVQGQVRATYGSRDGLGQGRVNNLRTSPDGTLWVATEGGLSRLRAGHFATLGTRDGLPCDNVDSSIEAEGSLWVYTACGLVLVAPSDLQLWTTAVDHAQIQRSKVRLTVLDESDGVPSFSTVSTMSPHIGRTADGKLWFVAEQGLIVVDPRHLPFNKLPPPVHVVRMIADRAPIEASMRLHLPPLVRDLEIDYTALSLVAPDKVLFRYRLEGRDRDWQDVGNRRQAYYSDLLPGTYRFRVIASNNSGVWNEQGATLDFSVAPAYWQTSWFRALCAAAFLGLLWLLYVLRLRQVTHTFNKTLEARVAERTRIARELHDTLLQSFQGLLLRFQTVAHLLPARPEEAERLVVSVVDQAAQAITEGRNAVQGLRTSVADSADLAVELRSLAEVIATETHNQSVDSWVEVEGNPRPLHPLVRDEIYRIAGEALRNAFRHADPKRIEVELRYDTLQLRLRIRDNGKGINLKFLSEGDQRHVAGHFGIRGMRERAQVIGAKLTIWSALGSGTEIELTVPASRVYVRSARARSWLAEKLSRTRPENAS